MKAFLAIILTVTGISMACAGYKSTSSPAVANDDSPTQPLSNSTVNASSQDKPTCTLNISSSPVINGLKLRMTVEEVLAVFPGSKEDPSVKSKLESPSPLGNLSFVIRPEKYGSKPEFEGVSQITFSVLDGRVANFTVGHNGPQWKHVDEFVAKFVDGSGLPNADQWVSYDGLDTQMKTLTCSDFSVRVFAGGEGGNLNYILVQDLEAEKQLKERRRKAREQARPTPGQ